MKLWAVIECREDFPELQWLKQGWALWLTAAMDWNKILVCYCTQPAGSAGFKEPFPLKFCPEEQSGMGFAPGRGWWAQIFTVGVKDGLNFHFFGVLGGFWILAEPTREVWLCWWWQVEVLPKISFIFPKNPAWFALIWELEKEKKFLLATAGSELQSSHPSLWSRF